jgi:predicted lysophospholipase L1 biosynthesis ABC-type transport system permease subunit
MWLTVNRNNPIRSQPQKTIEFPILEAARISVEHIRKRLYRSLIIVCSIALGIALLTHLEVTNLLYAAHLREAGLALEGYQFWLIIISLLVCGIGLINANLIAIYERYREIGTMKFLGALDQHVMKLFLVEAVLFGGLGGLLGFSIGTVTAILASTIQLGVNTLFLMPIITVLQDLGLILTLSILITVISTVYPAWRAARLNPIEALSAHI